VNNANHPALLEVTVAEHEASGIVFHTAHSAAEHPPQN
jgi:hypothetical protein